MTKMAWIPSQHKSGYACWEDPETGGVTDLPLCPGHLLWTVIHNIVILLLITFYNDCYPDIINLTSIIYCILHCIDAHPSDIWKNTQCHVTYVDHLVVKVTPLESCLLHSIFLRILMYRYHVYFHLCSVTFISHKLHIWSPYICPYQAMYAFTLL